MTLVYTNMAAMLKNRKMYEESENKLGFWKFSFVWFLFSNGTYLKNDPHNSGWDNNFFFSLTKSHIKIFK